MRKISVPVIKAYTVDGERVDLESILNCPFEDISEAAERIPALIGWFGFQKAVTMERLINREHLWKEAEARQYFALKNEGKFVSQGFGEKITEAALEKAVPLMPEVKQAVEAYAKCKRNLVWIDGTIEALKAKLDLVRSSEVTRRMEHEGDKQKGPSE